MASIFIDIYSKPRIHIRPEFSYYFCPPRVISLSLFPIDTASVGGRQPGADRFPVSRIDVDRLSIDVEL